MEFDTVELNLQGMPGFGKYLGDGREIIEAKVNGTPLRNLTSIKIEAGLDSPTKVTVEFYANVRGTVQIPKTLPPHCP